MTCIRFLLTGTQDVVTLAIHLSVTSMASGVSSQWQIVPPESTDPKPMTFIDREELS